jgi:hypothetical protein
MSATPFALGDTRFAMREDAYAKRDELRAQGIPAKVKPVTFKGRVVHWWVTR